MFIGHFAVGMASKRIARHTSLSWLILAPLFLDVLWPVFLLFGLESVRIEPGNTAVTPLDLHDYPYSHSIAMSVVWSLAFGGLYFAFTRKRVAALVLGGLVFSHAILDVVTHRPDMPLYPGSAVQLGFGLWNSRAATFIVEVAMFAWGVWVYARSTRGIGWRGTIGLASFATTLAAVYLANFFGPPPPSESVVMVGTFLMWLFIPWAAWVDRNRSANVT